MAAFEPKRTSLPSARWVLTVVVVANLSIALAQIVAGSAADSAAVRADGFHSLVDASASLLGLAAVAYALRPTARMPTATASSRPSPVLASSHCWRC